VEQVEASLLPELTPESRLAELGRYEAGSLDVFELKGMDAAEVERARQRHSGEFVSTPELMVYYLVFDVSQPPFDDRRVRQAFGHAINKGTLVDVVMRSQDFPATGGFVPPGMPGHSPGLALPHDPVRARRLLVEAGYPDGRDLSPVPFFPFQRLIPEGEELRRQWLDNLGIATTVTTESRLAHLVLLAWEADYPDPDNLLRVAVHDHQRWWRSARQQAWWWDEAYEEIVERARRLMDQRRRMELYRQAERILVEEVPWVPLGYTRRQLLVKPWVRNFPTSPVGWSFWKDVVIEPH
jgi:ABC-type transport system substrate-binding protein